MKRLVLIGVLAFAAAVSFASSASAAGDSAGKIVVFKSSVTDGDAQAAIVTGHGGLVRKRLPLVNAVAANLPPQAQAALMRRVEVARIDDDLVVSATGPVRASKRPAPDPVEQPPQTTPWGISRIGATAAWAATTGSAVKVAILDTGIDLNHPDLAGNIAGARNFINPRKSGEDDNGHGTHVAGTIAAEANTIGVVGVGPGIDIYALKVLGRNGIGTLSDIVDALGWCVDNNIQVANMSLGSSGGNQTYHDAIAAAWNAGVVIVAAAGNNGPYPGEVDYPAEYDETIAVSALDQYDQLAEFSSFGGAVDVAAPGVSILSTWKGDIYAYSSGTSMATPHVTGVAALIVAQPVGAYDADGDGAWDAAEVRFKIRNTAEDLGLPGYEQGTGIVRADLATQ